MALLDEPTSINREASRGSAGENRFRELPPAMAPGSAARAQGLQRRFEAAHATRTRPDPGTRMEWRQRARAACWSAATPAIRPPSPRGQPHIAGRLRGGQPPER